MPIRPHYYSNHPPRESIAIRKTRMLNKRLPQTATLEENDDIIKTDDMDDILTRMVTQQIKANFWQMLKNMKSEEQKELENDQYFTNAMQRKYFRTT